MKNKRTQSDILSGAMKEHPDPSGPFRAGSRWGVLAAGALLAFTLAACGGDDGKDGKDADPAVLDDLQAQIDEITKAINPETCVTCHTGDNPVARSGPMHQELYEQFYQDGVVKVSNMAFSAAGTTATLTFRMTKNGAPFDCTKPSGGSNDFAIGSYWAGYDAGTNTFTANQSMAGTKSYNAATNVCTFTRSGLDAGLVAQMNGNGIVQIYGTDEIVERNQAKRISIGKYPFAGVLKIGTVNYETAANVSGCENCHTRPFLKHAYIYGEVVDNTGATTEFYTCKGCHYDTRNGGHQDWQILKDDPDRYADIALGHGAITDAEKAKYAYKAKLMNDVHMSHAMEFAYPQSMKNCVTCHEGKLDRVLSDAQFKGETCQSCHAIDTLRSMMVAGSPIHATMDLQTTDCTTCHKSAQQGGFAPQFVTLHNGGFDPKIYANDGTRYSDTFVVKVDAASFDANTNKLTINFSATEVPDLASWSVSDIKPMVLIGLYGYDSKDFIVAAHGRDADRNRLLEWVVGTSHPRFTGGATGSGTWEVTADLSMWADMIADGIVKRAEIGILPQLDHPTLTEEGRSGPQPMVLGLDAPSRTFDLGANVFDDGYYGDIVDVKNGCNTCHDQLATTFHSGNRGGNIKVCRMCHVVSSGGSHLELQSRSIDSYVHAVHSFQAFDPGDIDFGNDAESVEYTHHINTDFPRFGILNCESCHKPGMYNVPNQAKSMPGILSGTDEVEGRDIAPLPATVTGPAVRACGACHRAQKLNADDASALTVLNQHFKTFGYIVEDEPGVWEATVAKIMGLFK